MTIDELTALDRESITIAEAADIIGCSPQRLRDGLDLDEERPVNMRRYLFPHCKVGNRHSIMRRGFLAWVEGRVTGGEANG